MPEQPATNAYGVSRGKLILIGALSLVLIAVVYWNYFRGDPQAVAASASDTSTAAPRQRRTVSSRGGGNRGRSRVRPASDSATRVRLQKAAWPNYDLDDVAAYDPFALPSGFPAPQVAEIRPPNEVSQSTAQEEPSEEDIEMTLQTLQAEGVKAIIRSGDEFVAVIGEQTVRVGDKIKGFRVVAIGNDGVTIEPEVPQ